MIENGEPEFQYSEMPDHPDQAYTKKMQIKGEELAAVRFF